jgi:hypothetical protein
LNFSPILKFEFTFLALNKEHGRSIHRLPSRLGSAVSKTLAESGSAEHEGWICRCREPARPI